ncbi:hypothetical protein [Streptomyces orinoci]|uniref:MFS transporter n=1 Tax=Streptomyces orinoci TaxID=67339 RepID=A0ABV3JWM1_STRON|nr:hypothetical protein [Streptomyces orinoci]
MTARRPTLPELTMALVPLFFPLAVALPSGLPAGQVVLTSTIGIFPAAFSYGLGSWILARHNRLRLAALTGCLSTSLFGCLVVGSFYYGFIFAVPLALLFGFLGLLSLWGTWALALDRRWGAAMASFPLCLITAFGLSVPAGGAAAALAHLTGWTCLAVTALLCALTLFAPRAPNPLPQNPTR